MILNQVINKEKDSKNIIMWYPFEENSNILEIGANSIETTNILLNKAKLVTSVVFTEKIKQEYFTKLKSEKLEIVCEKINDIELNKKYDYILLIDVIKYSKLLLPNSMNPILDILTLCKKNLSDNGKILLATDNRFGVKNFSGNYSENEEKIFQILEEKNEEYKLYTKLELIDTINELEFDFKFYYPYPNLKNTNVIFSENYLPKGNNSKINYNVLYDSKSKIILDEINLIKQFAKNNIADIFSNSFFIEIFKRNCKKLESDIRYVGFNNLRKEKYKTLLTIENNYVLKTAYSKDAIVHIQKLIENTERLKQLSLNVLEEIDDDITVKLKYISNDKLLDNILCKLLEENKINEFFKIIDLWIKKCLYKLEKDETKYKILNLEIDKKLAEELYFVKDGFIDLVFENSFYVNDEFIIYDQEWKFDNIPLEFILYRGITNLYTHNEYLNEILDYEYVLKFYELDKYKDIFNKVEENIQKIIVDDEAVIKYFQSENKKVNLEDIYQKSIEYSKLISKINILKDENLNLNNENINLKNNLKALQDYQVYVENSRAWKIIKKVNKFLKR